MSHAYYSAAWQSAMEELSAQIELENPPVQLNDNGKPLPEKSITWDDAFQHFACLYLRYLGIYRKLEECYDQMIHPQKRQDLKFILEVVMARLTQVKAQCVKFGPDGRPSDYLNLENYLLDLKLGPEALEIPIPRYFKEKSDNDDANKKRDVLEKCLEEHGMVGGIDTDAGYSSYIPKLTKDQAIRIIQKNERGRQGNVRAKLMKELRDEDSMRKKLTASGTGQAHPTTAATLIQKVFRGHLIRMKIAKQTQEEFVFLGMKSLSLNMRKGALPGTEGAGGAGGGPAAAAASAAAAAQQSKSSKYDPLTKEAQIRAQRKTRQIEHELKYIESLVELQKSVTEVEGPEMKDAMWEERSERPRQREAGKEAMGNAGGVRNGSSEKDRRAIGSRAMGVFCFLSFPSPRPPGRYQWWIEAKAKTGKYPENFNNFYRERGEGDGLVEKKKKKVRHQPARRPRDRVWGESGHRFESRECSTPIDGTLV